jgi:hypothetical protein
MRHSLIRDEVSRQHERGNICRPAHGLLGDQMSSPASTNAHPHLMRFRSSTGRVVFAANGYPAESTERISTLSQFVRCAKPTDCTGIALVHWYRDQSGSSATWQCRYAGQRCPTDVRESQSNEMCSSSCILALGQRPGCCIQVVLAAVPVFMVLQGVFEVPRFRHLTMLNSDLAKCNVKGAAMRILSLCASSLRYAREADRLQHVKHCSLAETYLHVGMCW